MSEVGGAISRVTHIQVVPMHGKQWFRLVTRGSAPVTILELNPYAMGILLGFGGNLHLVPRDEVILVLERAIDWLKELE